MFRTFTDSPCKCYSMFFHAEALELIRRFDSSITNMSASTKRLKGFHVIFCVQSAAKTSVFS